MFLFEFGVILAHRVDAGDGFERGKGGTQRQRGGRVADQLRRHVGFRVLLFERIVQAVDAFDKGRIFDPFFHPIGKAFQFRHGERQGRALRGVAIHLRVGQVKAIGDFVRFSFAHHAGNFRDVGQGVFVIGTVRLVSVFAVRVKIAGGVVFHPQLGGGFLFDL